MFKLLSKTILICLSLFLLASCSKKTSEYTDSFILPEKLKHCQIYAMRSEEGTVLKVIHCPYSSTTTNYHSNKTTKSVTIIDENPIQMGQ